MNRLITEFQIPIGSVIHIGASLLQEARKYSSFGYKPIYWFEAIPELVLEGKKIAKEFPDNFVFQKLLWKEANIEKQFYLSSNEYQSSSVFPMLNHHLVYPGIFHTSVQNYLTSTLDDCFEIQHQDEYSLIVLDVQGSEFEVLLGSKLTLKKTWAVFLEVSTIEMYLGQSTFSKVHDFLSELDFRLVEHDLDSNKFMGDALYLNMAKVNQDKANKFGASGLPKANTLYFWRPKTALRRLLLKFGIAGDRITIRTFFSFLHRRN